MADAPEAKAPGGKFEVKLTKDQQQQIFLAVVLIVGGGYAYVTYFWKPIAAKITETTQKIERTIKEIEEAERQARRLPKLMAEIADLEKKAEAAEKRLPRSKGVPNLIDTLGELARQYSVTVGSFSPGSVAPKGNFVEVSYKLTITGNYHSVAKFLTALALQERIFHARNLVLTPTGGESRAETVSGSFTLVAFQYKG